MTSQPSGPPQNQGDVSPDAALPADAPMDEADAQRYRQLFECNPTPMWVYDLQTLRFLDVNEVACQKYGYTRDEFLSMTIRDIRPPEDIAAMEESVLQTPAQVFNSGVWRHRLKDGRLIYVEITSHETRYRGRLARFVAPLDVTERVQAEAALRILNEDLESRVLIRTQQLEASNRELMIATSAAEAANQAKSEFLTRMSHELRTPLNAVIGFAQLLSQPNHGFPAERQAAFHEHILQAGQHLLKLIGELLNLASIEAGKVDLEMQPLHLAELLAECEIMIAAQAQARGLTTRFVSTAAHPIGVIADRTRLKQVMLNLLSNAVKYNRPQGQITVTANTLGAERVRIEVRDTGLGLTPQQVAHLFEAFNRLGRSKTGPNAIEGTGLGLVVTKHLVELMGGRIGVDSTPGVGTCFWLELVAAENATPQRPLTTQPQPSEASKPPRPQRTVLLVEDDLPSQALVKAQLSQRTDLRLVVASNGREGIALALAHQPDVILMDNKMPEITGRQAVQLLAQDPRTSHIPVIAISAGADSSAAVGMESDAIRWFRQVVKPFNQGDLLTAIDDAIHAGDDSTPG